MDRNCCGLSPIDISAQNGHINILEYLIREGVYPFEINPIEDLQHDTGPKYSNISDASPSQNNQIKSSYSKPLFHAVVSCQYDVIKFLLLFGCNPYIRPPVINQQQQQIHDRTSTSVLSLSSPYELATQKNSGKVKILIRQFTKPEYHPPSLPSSTTSARSSNTRVVKRDSVVGPSRKSTSPEKIQSVSLSMLGFIQLDLPVSSSAKRSSSEPICHEGVTSPQLEHTLAVAAMYSVATSDHTRLPRSNAIQIQRLSRPLPLLLLALGILLVWLSALRVPFWLWLGCVVGGGLLLNR